MDETSQKLLQELSGIGSRPLDEQSTTGSAAQKQIPALKEDKHDHWRILLVDLAYLISDSFRDVHYWEGIKAEKGTFRQLSKVLDELDQMAVHDELVRINHRGVRSAKTSEQADYVIQFGDISVDIELTPEEVLLVKDGLNTHVVNYVAWKVDAEQKPLLEKMVAVRKSLIEAMNPDLSERQHLPIRYLMALEREIHIFLALVGGKTAFEVMRSALNVYGNPASRIYRLKESPNHFEALLLHLAAIIRGFVRQSGKSDFSLLAEVKTRQDQFRELHEDLRYQALVRRVMDLIDASEAAIGADTH